MEALPNWAKKVLKKEAFRIFDPTRREDFISEAVLKYLSLAPTLEKKFPEPLSKQAADHRYLYWRKIVRNLRFDLWKNDPLAGVAPLISGDCGEFANTPRHSASNPKSFSIVWYSRSRDDGSVEELERDAGWVSRAAAKVHAESPDEVVRIARCVGLDAADIHFKIVLDGNDVSVDAEAPTSEITPADFLPPDADEIEVARFATSGALDDIAQEESEAPGSSWTGGQDNYQYPTRSFGAAPDPSDEELTRTPAPERAKVAPHIDLDRFRALIKNHREGKGKNDTDCLLELADRSVFRDEPAAPSTVLAKEVGKRYGIPWTSLWRWWGELVDGYKKILDSPASKIAGSKTFFRRTEHGGSLHPAHITELCLGLYGLRHQLITDQKEEWKSFDYAPIPIRKTSPLEHEEQRQPWWIDDVRQAGEEVFPWTARYNEFRSLSRVGMQPLPEPRWIEEKPRKWMPERGQGFSSRLSSASAPYTRWESRRKSKVISTAIPGEPEVGKFCRTHTEHLQNPRKPDCCGGLFVGLDHVLLPTQAAILAVEFLREVAARSPFFANFPTPQQRAAIIPYQNSNKQRRQYCDACLRKKLWRPDRIVAAGTAKRLEQEAARAAGQAWEDFVDEALVVFNPAGEPRYVVMHRQTPEIEEPSTRIALPTHEAVVQLVGGKELRWNVFAQSPIPALEKTLPWNITPSAEPSVTLSRVPCAIQNCENFLETSEPIDSILRHPDGNWTFYICPRQQHKPQVFAGSLRRWARTWANEQLLNPVSIAQCPRISREEEIDLIYRSGGWFKYLIATGKLSGLSWVKYGHHVARTTPPVGWIISEFAPPAERTDIWEGEWEDEPAEAVAAD